MPPTHEPETESGFVGDDRTAKRPPRTAALPLIRPWKLRFFRAYTHRYLRRHFHAVRIEGLPELPADRPAVVYLNHAAWWDPLICLFLSEHFFPQRPAYAPIEAQQLDRYAIFRGLGFFGVEPGTPRGGITFLRTSSTVLRDPQNMLWLTPQGRFADPRERPMTMQEGLGQLARRERGAVYVPLAIEYPFWNERKPEVLIRFGAPITDAGLPPVADGPEMQSRFLAARLEQAQDSLAIAAQSRDASRFITLLGGESGVGGIYDAWRRWRARCRGETFHSRHGDDAQ